MPLPNDKKRSSQLKTIDSVAAGGRAGLTPPSLVYSSHLHAHLVWRTCPPVVAVCAWRAKRTKRALSLLLLNWDARRTQLGCKILVFLNAKLEIKLPSEPCFSGASTVSETHWSARMCRCESCTKSALNVNVAVRTNICYRSLSCWTTRLPSNIIIWRAQSQLIESLEESCCAQLSFQTQQRPISASKRKPNHWLLLRDCVLDEVSRFSLVSSVCCGADIYIVTWGWSWQKEAS